MAVRGPGRPPAQTRWATHFLARGHNTPLVSARLFGQFRHSRQGQAVSGSVRLTVYYSVLAGWTSSLLRHYGPGLRRTESSQVTKPQPVQLYLNIIFHPEEHTTLISGLGDTPQLLFGCWKINLENLEGCSNNLDFKYLQT